MTSTSWGAGRSRATAAALITTSLAAALALGAAGPAAAAERSDYLVTGTSSAAAVRTVGGAVGASVGQLTTARLTATEARRLAARGLRVLPDGAVRLESLSPASENQSATGRLSVNALTESNTVSAAGAGITVAVVDSGVSEVPGLTGRVDQGPDFSGDGMTDFFGHGTFVAGLIAGNGRDANGQQTGIQGIAPQARILSVKVGDRNGASTVGRVAAGIAWVVANKARLNIRVLNLSLSVDGDSSYLDGPINALVEAAWYKGVVVVASAGNDGQNAVRRAPANDPLILTVGSVRDQNTANNDDDLRSTFSNVGATVDQFAKPEIALPGQHVQSTLPAGSVLAGRQTTTGLPSGYGQLSGTSMSAGVGSGMVAALLSARPGLTPNQVKGILVSQRESNLSVSMDDASRASVSTANVGVKPSIALASAYAELIVGTTDYASIQWASVDYGAVAWEKATWTNATWTNATWSNATWSNNGWKAGAAAQATWSNATWSSATWSNVRN